MPRKKSSTSVKTQDNYGHLLGSIAEILADARRATARTVNALMTATYWEIGRRIVEFEQGGAERAEYGKELLMRLATDLTHRFGRGFSRQNLQNMRQFYLTFSPSQIRQTLSGKSSDEIRATLSLEFESEQITHTRSAKSPTQIRSTVSGESRGKVPAKRSTLSRESPTLQIWQTPSAKSGITFRSIVQAV